MAPGPQVVAVGEAARDDTASTPPTVASPCHRISASPPSAPTASMTSCSQFDPGKRTTPTRGAIRLPPSRRADRGVLDHRVGEEPPAEILDLGSEPRPRRPPRAEADGLADPDASYAVEAERGQRPLDRRALRIGDAGPQCTSTWTEKSINSSSHTSTGDKCPVVQERSTAADIVRRRHFHIIGPPSSGQLPTRRAVRERREHIGSHLAEEHRRAALRRTRLPHRRAVRWPTDDRTCAEEVLDRRSERFAHRCPTVLRRRSRRPPRRHGMAAAATAGPRCGYSRRARQRPCSSAVRASAEPFGDGSTSRVPRRYDAQISRRERPRRRRVFPQPASSASCDAAKAAAEGSLHGRDRRLRRNPQRRRDRS